MHLSPRIAFVVVAFLFAAQLSAQSKEPDKIVVIGSSSMRVPADRIAIDVCLTFADSIDGKQAYEHHKLAEQKLMAFLHSAQIPDSAISYSLLNITPTSTESWRNKAATVFNTNQSVTVVLDDLSNYSHFMLALISNGFASFNQHFTSSKASSQQNQLILMAVKQARAEAELMAYAAGRRIKRISKVSDTEDTEPSLGLHGQYSIRRLPGVSVRGISDVSELASIPQTILIEKEVKVVFDLAD